MKLLNLHTLFLACFGPVVFAVEPEDWRLQLLKEEGLTLKAAEAEFENGDHNVSEKQLLDLIALLGSEDFSTRINSQKAIERMGLAAKPWLDHLPEQDDPEIVFRLSEIRKNLSSERQWKTSELLRYAINDLVREKKGEKPDKNSPVVFAELFCEKAPTLKDGYRHFVFISDPGLKGEVSDGALRLSGKNPGEGDQRLVLESKKIGRDKGFPDTLRVEVSLKSTPGGEGVHHIGVAIGNVRALFHPGYSGGGFRFERVDTKAELSTNANMGFTPKTGVFSTMGIDVERLPNKKVKLSVSVTQKGAKAPFQASIEVAADVIGDLNSISLDRSGNRGGDAIFDNFVVEMNR